MSVRRSRKGRSVSVNVGLKLAAGFFVLSWSTGFVVARALEPHADPGPFLAARFGICALVFLVVALARRVTWPEARVAWSLVGIGVLHQGVYACASFWAVDNGLQPALMTLLGTLQPPLTALVATRLLGERLDATARVGLALGVTGTGVAVWPTDGIGSGELAVIAAAVSSVLAITFGTLLQKSAVARVAFAPSSALQYVGGASGALVLAAITGEHRLAFGPELAGLLGYAVVVLSLLGTTLLVWMVREGSATRAASLLFLTPPLSALLVWLLFDEGLSARQSIGFAVAVTGVFLARRVSAPKAPPT